MGFLLKQIFELFRLLNSDTGANQIAAGIAAGLILGFAPALSLQTLLVVLCLFFFRIQMGAALVSAFFFAFVAWMLDPVHHMVGQAVLESDGLRPLFTSVYNMPLVPLTRFNNTVVMGAAVVSIVLAPFVFAVAKLLIIKYRATILVKFENTRLWKLWKATPFYKWYTTYDQLYG